MGRESLDQLRRRLRREILPSSSARYTDALLLVRAPDGTEAWRAGGAWDNTFREWAPDAADVQPRIVTLEKSQWVQPDGTPGIGQAFARHLEAKRRGERGTFAFIAMGPRGSGKTYICGGIIAWTLALEYPFDYTFAVAVQGKAKREVIDALAEIAGPNWIKSDSSENPQDPETELITGHRVLWHTGTRPKSFRFAGLPIRHVMLNEGQAQSVAAAVNAAAATRNVGGLLSVATNPPTEDAGNWIVRVVKKIEAEEMNAQAFMLGAKDNASINQDAVTDIGSFIQAVDESAYRADILGEMSIAGEVAYRGFKRAPVEKGGNLGDPPPLPDIGPALWTDITEEETLKYAPSQGGFQYVGGTDFQGDPGCCTVVGKIYRRPDGKKVLHVVDTVGAEGVEEDLSQALLAKGYTQSTLMLIGDATGARQSAKHDDKTNYSFDKLGKKGEGWTIDSPDRHRKTGRYWWAPKRENRKQVNGLFRTGQILITPSCSEAPAPFKSLLDCLDNCKITTGGDFERKGHWTHLPDGLRMLAWRFLDRPRPPGSKPLDEKTIDAVMSIRLVGK